MTTVYQPYNIWALEQARFNIAWTITQVYIKQSRKKQYITDYIIEFKVLAIKIETNDMYIIFLLKKNFRSDIIKTILGYLFNVALKILKS